MPNDKIILQIGGQMSVMKPEEFAESYSLMLVREMDKTGAFTREVIEKSGEMYKNNLLTFLQSYGKEG